MADPLLALGGLAIAYLGIEAIGAVADRLGGDSGGDGDDGQSVTVRSDLRKWIPAAALVGYVLLVEGQSLSSIGAEWLPPATFAAWVVGGFAFTYLVGVLGHLAWTRLGLDSPEGFVEEQARRPVSARLFTALTAGVTESVLYHGYPIERLASLIGSVPAAGAVAVVVFTVAHYLGNDVFSVQETLFIGIPALSVTVLYVLSGNLFVVMTVHALVDAVSLLAPDLGADVDSEGPAEPTG